ncbi:MAG: hypothetical protein O8C62_08095 [Candidatus Methanoperedens sp.]|nr:hypothetical protein [Candidatus Methanoperedens sp.]
MTSGQIKFITGENLINSPIIVIATIIIPKIIHRTNTSDLFFLKKLKPVTMPSMGSRLSTTRAYLKTASTRPKISRYNTHSKIPAINKSGAPVFSGDKI